MMAEPSDQGVQNLITRAEELKRLDGADDVLADLWSTLQDSEQKMILLFDGKKPGEDVAGYIELGPALHVLNNLPRILFPLADALRMAGMPQSAISPEKWSEYEHVLVTGGCAGGDGTLFAGNGSLEYLWTYVQFDPGWAVAVFKYALVIAGLEPRAEFGKTPKKLAIDPEQHPRLTIAVAGDWGTGHWTDGDKPRCPSQLVADGIVALDPDLTIHLGDVYYAGTKESLLLFEGEEQTNFVELWHPGSLGSFTLDSNHEMYSGARGYFEIALDTSITPLFAQQQRTSYFSIEYGDWLVLGLDSAYYDPSPMFMDGALYDPARPTIPEGAQHQLDFIEEAGATGKRIIVMTHHNPLTVDGAALTTNGENTGLLWNQVVSALGRAPDYWYWGHVHNGIVYNEQSAIATARTDGSACRGRCVGHAAIPFGDGYELHDNPTVEFYTHTPMPDRGVQQSERVLNGFATITLERHTIAETLHQVSNDPAYQRPVWHCPPVQDQRP
jgi:hypothetical protein